MKQTLVRAFLIFAVSSNGHATEKDSATVIWNDDAIAQCDHACADRKSILTLPPARQAEALAKSITSLTEELMRNKSIDRVDFVPMLVKLQKLALAAEKVANKQGDFSQKTIDAFEPLTGYCDKNEGKLDSLFNVDDLRQLAIKLHRVLYELNTRTGK